MEGTARHRRGIESGDLYREICIGSRDAHRSGGRVHRRLAPIDAHPETLVLRDRAVGFAENNPRLAGGGGEIERSPALVKDVNIMPLPVEFVELRQSGIVLWRAVEGDAHGRSVGYRDFRKIDGAQ